jgi:hypothetical protein
MTLEADQWFLCGSKASGLLRAIRLYGLQAEIFHRLGSKQTKMARILAGWRILERMEANKKGIRNLSDRLAIPNYREVLDHTIREGGARRLRSLSRMGEFSKEVEDGVRCAQDVAAMVHFSHRHAEFGPRKPHQTGGTNMARHFLKWTSGPGGPSEKTRRNRLKTYRDRAVLQYLILYHHKHLRPVNLSNKAFVRRLLKQATDRQALAAFFASYADLVKVLRPRGYNFVDLNRPSRAPRTRFELDDFSKREWVVVDAYPKDPIN